MTRRLCTNAAFKSPRVDGTYQLVNSKAHALLLFTTGEVMQLGRVGITRWFSRGDWYTALCCININLTNAYIFIKSIAPGIVCAVLFTKPLTRC